MATYSSIPAEKIPWTEEPGGYRGRKGSDMTEQLTLPLQKTGTVRSSTFPNLSEIVLLEQPPIKNEKDFLGGSVVKTLPLMQGAWVQSLVGELGSHMLHGQKQINK